MTFRDGIAGVNTATSTSAQDSTSKWPATTQKDDVKDRVYVLGTGSIGKFIAHSIYNHPNPPPVTLLFHKPLYLLDFKKPENGSQLTVTTHGAPEQSGPFDYELVLPVRKRNWRGSKDTQQLMDRNDVEKRFGDYVSDAPIRNLIVTTKAQQTVKSLRPLKHRLGKDSTILFLQNGCGTIDEVNKNVFPDPLDRPHYMLGINSHGVTATGPTTATHAGHGVIYLGILPRDGANGSRVLTSESSRSKSQLNDVEFSNTSIYLLRCLARLPILSVFPVPPSALTLYQLDKLAVNCVVNPLTVLLDAPNGSLLNNHHLSRTMRLLLFEISAIFRRLPEVEGLPNIDVRFGPDRLEDLVISVARKTSGNISSMLQDVRRGTETEIDYLNGYVVRRGEELGVKAVVNYSMVTLVKGKQSMVSREVEGWIPHEGKSG